MHMADALISPLVAGTMLTAAAGVAAYSIHRLDSELDNKKIPLMGVMGAFIFAAQMINFAIPGTGSSGHIGGGMLLAIILGPYTGFLTMASVLLIQALFFADGGLLAYGCNLINLGLFTCFVAYPLIYKWLTHRGLSRRNIFMASLISVVVALQLGSLGVVLETFFSGKTDLPFTTFLIMMQSIHLAIGVIEGLITGAVVSFVWQARPEILERTTSGLSLGGLPIKRLLTGLTIIVILVGGGLSWFASDKPDGLEWSMLKTAGVSELTINDNLHKKIAGVQKELAILPDYSFKSGSESGQTAKKSDPAWSSAKAETSLSGLVGGVLTLLLAAVIGLIINLVKSRKNRLA